MDSGLGFHRHGEGFDTQSGKIISVMGDDRQTIYQCGGGDDGIGCFGSELLPQLYGLFGDFLGEAIRGSMTNKRLRLAVEPQGWR